MPPHILVVGFLIPIFCLVIASAIPTAGAIDCFKCVSMNGTNAACDDPFHNNHSLDILESPCMGGRKGRDGLFPATSCIKIAGVYDDTGERITVRGCALDSGTLTTDTEIIRMSHCGRFYYDDRYVHGCLQSCSDSDACNSGNSITGNHRHFHWIRGLFTSANLAAFLSLLYSLLADIGDDCCLFRRKMVTGRRRMRNDNSMAKGDRIDGVREITDKVKKIRRIREIETNGKSEESEVESRRGNSSTREKSGKEKDKRRIEEDGKNMKGEESVVNDGVREKMANEARKTSTRENAMNLERRRITEGKDGVSESSINDVKKYGFRERMSETGVAIIDQCVNKKEFDKANDIGKENNTISGKECHVNNCSRSVNKGATGKERRDLECTDKRKLNILRDDGTGEETNERYEKRGSVNRGRAEDILKGDSVEAVGVEKENVRFERKKSGTISAVEVSTGEMNDYCIFEKCTDVNISELKKFCSYFEVRDNCNNFCKGSTNVTDFHVNSCKVSTNCPDVNNDSCKIPTNCSDIHNDSSKVPTNFPGIHNDSCKVPINCPGIHNDSSQVSINCPGIHNDSCKIPTNCRDFEDYHIKKNCPQLRLNPAALS